MSYRCRIEPTTTDEAQLDRAVSERVSDEVAEHVDIRRADRLLPTLDDTTTFTAILVVTAAPFVIVMISLLTTQWAPSSDRALQILEVGDVGSRRTPLLGAWSRWGWNHPGPWPTYLLTPFTALLGAKGALVGTLFVNMASLLTAVVVGRRRGGTMAAGLVALFGLAIGFAHGPTFLMDVWNPYAAVLPLYALAIAAWALSDRDWAVVPLVVVFASFSVQAHVGFLPIAAVLCIGGAALAGFARSPSTELPGPVHEARRPMIVGAVIAAIAWLPPLVDQLVHRPGNANLLLKYAANPPEDAVGWSIAWRVFAFELSVPRAWVTGREFELFEAAASPVGAVASVSGVAVVGALAHRSGHASAARLAALTLVAVAGAITASARITGLPYDYLLTWWWSVGALVWFSISWSTWSLLQRPGRTAAAHAMRSATVVLVLLLSLGLALRSLGADPPLAEQSRAIRALIDQIEPQLQSDETHVIRWYDERDWGAVGIGLFTGLLDRGVDVVVPSTEGVKFDPWRTAPSADNEIVVVSGDDMADTDVPVGAELIGSYDPLDAAERLEYERQWAAIAAEAGPDIASSPSLIGSPVALARLRTAVDDQSSVDRFIELWSRGSSFAVYLVPTPDT